MNDPNPMDRDLAALRNLSARDVPELDDTIQAIRRRRLDTARAPWYSRRKIMALLQSIRTRPAVAAAFAGALAVLVAMVVPVSYERVVGQDVALTVAGQNLGSAEIAGVAQGLKQALSASSVMVEATPGGGPFVLHATLPRRSGGDVRRATGVFANELASRGYAASVQVTPRREKVRYPAVAYAFDQIINISVDGKSAAALEAEIRDRLSQAGVPDAQVSVTDRPDGGREVKMTVERQAVNDGTQPPPEPMPQIVLSKNGTPMTGGEGIAVKVKKLKTNSSTTLIVEVNSNGKTATVEVPNSDTMSDAAIADRISTQLHQAGIDARVTVTNGKVSIESNH
jgi:type IV pilus biogenesis protein CpaD/CtpE